ncbi:hypothetical protein EJB05_21504, partial [Eragrostis curvula]
TAPPSPREEEEEGEGRRRGRQDEIGGRNLKELQSPATRSLSAQEVDPGIILLHDGSPLPKLQPSPALHAAACLIPLRPCTCIPLSQVPTAELGVLSVLLLGRLLAVTNCEISS